MPPQIPPELLHQQDKQILLPQDFYSWIMLVLASFLNSSLLGSLASALTIPIVPTK